MQIAIGNDHRGVELKESLVRALSVQGHEFRDAGAHPGEAVDYPDVAAAVSQQVAAGTVDRGILICGTGIGMAITANKFPQVRAAVCQDETTAAICRRHNDANVLCLSGDLTPEHAARIANVWLTTEFEGGRHARRVDKISQIERANTAAAKHDA